MINKGVSIIICCYNSAKRLPQTLLHIAKQKIPETIACELIVVDNNCTDDTVAVTNSIWNELASNIPLTIIEEKTPGLSSARHKGVASANYEYIIFCDDDNWLEEHYIERAYSILESDISIGIIGCKIEAVYELEPESWVIKHSEYLAIGPPDDIKDGDITAKIGLVFGAGMVLRKQLFSHLNAINYTFFITDRKGEMLTSCGDGEICFCARLLGYKIFFSNNLQLKHFIPKERTTENYFKRLMFGLGYSGIYLLPYIYALHQKNIIGVEKLRTTWYWQSISALKAMIRIRFSTVKLSKEMQFQYILYKGRLKALLTIRGGYQACFNHVKGLLKR